jgi:hypothetical protein
MTVTERVLFSLVANRALAPSSKLAAADWITHDVHIDGLAATDDDACYRAMDWLHQVTDDLEKQVFDEVANLLNLEVDLLRQPGGEGLPVPAGPLQPDRREHAGQTGADLRHRTVRDLPQPRSCDARPAHTRTAPRPARRSHQQHRPAQRVQAR